VWAPFWRTTTLSSIGFARCTQRQRLSERVRSKTAHFAEMAQPDQLKKRLDETVE